MKYIKLFEETSTKKLIDILTKYYKSCEEFLRKNKLYSISTTRINNISDVLSKIISNKLSNHKDLISETESEEIDEKDYEDFSNKEIEKIKSLIPYIFEFYVLPIQDIKNKKYIKIIFRSRLHFFNNDNKVILKQRDKINYSLSDSFDEVQDKGYILLEFDLYKLKDDYYYFSIEVIQDDENKYFYLKPDQLIGLLSSIRNIIY